MGNHYTMMSREEKKDLQWELDGSNYNYKSELQHYIQSFQQQSMQD